MMEPIVMCRSSSLDMNTVILCRFSFCTSTASPPVGWRNTLNIYNSIYERDRTFPPLPCFICTFESELDLLSAAFVADCWAICLGAATLAETPFPKATVGLVCKQLPCWSSEWAVLRSSIFVSGVPCAKPKSTKAYLKRHKFRIRSHKRSINHSIYYSLLFIFLSHF